MEDFIRMENLKIFALTWETTSALKQVALW
jgi:hypothetical protein